MKNCCHIFSFSRFSSKRIIWAAAVCGFYTNFLSIYHSEVFLHANPRHLYSLEQLRWTCEWEACFHYASSVFKAHTLVGWHFWSLLCKTWRQRQPFAASTSTHRVWPALQYTLLPFSLSLFCSFLSDFTQIFPHNAGCGCCRFLLIHHLTWGYFQM